MKSKLHPIHCEKYATHTDACIDVKTIIEKKHLRFKSSKTKYKMNTFENYKFIL
jgi:hypothetical protein